MPGADAVGVAAGTATCGVRGVSVGISSATATPATLQSVKKGRTLPDAARLGAFATKFAQETGREINLHWLLTGRDGPFLGEPRPRRTASKLDIDIINTAMKLDVAAKRALLVLLTARET